MLLTLASSISSWVIALVHLVCEIKIKPGGIHHGRGGMACTKGTTEAPTISVCEGSICFLISVASDVSAPLYLYIFASISAPLKAYLSRGLVTSLIRPKSVVLQASSNLSTPGSIYSLPPYTIAWSNKAMPIMISHLLLLGVSSLEPKILPRQTHGQLLIQLSLPPKLGSEYYHQWFDTTCVSPMSTIPFPQNLGYFSKSSLRWPLGHPQPKQHILSIQLYALSSI